MQRIINILLLTFMTSCITEFLPVTEEQKELLVVEGLITNQPGVNTVKLSKSMPFGKKSEAKPLSGCVVTITDDEGNKFWLNETSPGTYLTDSAGFTGREGRTYTLHLKVEEETGVKNYVSDPVEMIPVPPIDSIYYEKIVVKEDYMNFGGIDACQVYIDTHDPQNRCRYFRWDFDETWILRLLWPVKNIKCWVSDKSKIINIKSTAAFDESRIVRQPINYISNNTDRLARKYSISINQYSLTEDEFIYWGKIQNISDPAGGLYDKIPASVPSNLFCVENPYEKVLGYFSVSAKSSKRIFIQDSFAGIVNQYPNCPTDTVYGDIEILGQEINVWVLSDFPPGYMGFGSPRIRILTDKKGCADCTTRGTIQKPPYWTGD